MMDVIEGNPVKELNVSVGVLKPLNTTVLIHSVRNCNSVFRAKHSYY